MIFKRSKKKGGIPDQPTIPKMPPAKKHIYPCDPVKHGKCRKTSCYLCGDGCKTTNNIEFIRYDFDDNNAFFVLLNPELFHDEDVKNVKDYAVRRFCEMVANFKTKEKEE